MLLLPQCASHPISHTHTARNPQNKLTYVYRETDPNADRKRLNPENFTPEDAKVLKEFGFDYDALASTPTLYKRKSILDYPNNGYE